MFALGCYHPKRHSKFNELNLFGADSKGWILNYKTPNTLLNDVDIELKEIKEKIKFLDTSRITFITDEKNREKLLKNLNLEFSNKQKLYGNLFQMSKKEKRMHRFKQIESYCYNNIFSQFKDYLIIIDCSEEMIDKEDLTPAIELFNGSIFRMIRKMIKNEKFPENTQILIISKKYGLLQDHMILLNIITLFPILRILKSLK